MNTSLTDRQQEVLNFLHTFQAAHGHPPATREIQRHFGFASQNAAMSHLRALARKGMVEQLGGRAWALKAAEVQTYLFAVPVFGTIPAGLPAANEQLAAEEIQVDLTVFGLPRTAEVFGLHVRGDSMVNAHIVDGDVALLQRKPPRPGNIVAALIDGETTLKRLVLERKRPVLRAENPCYKDLIPTERLEIQGVCIGVIGRGKR
ncbi:MAG TPA: transcriptional repressor LexA [Opitutaceae bacterium]|nr:transcriptional repressor LexA [Opitutaceae bacterium]